jgi:polyhydroxybutyrate depolymerase
MVRSYMNIWWWRNRSTNNQNDFIVAYPAWIWNWPYSWSQQENIEFFDGIVSYINNKMCINRDKVFSVGHSLWSWMSNKVSCLRWDVVRAMVWVASDWYNNNCYWAVSSLITHLKNDNLASYQGGLNAYSYKSSNNLCTSETEKISLWSIKNCEQKISCSWWNTVIFCNSYDTHQSDPHWWPRSGWTDILDFLNWFE